MKYTTYLKFLSLMLAALFCLQIAACARPAVNTDEASDPVTMVCSKDGGVSEETSFSTAAGTEETSAEADPAKGFVWKEEHRKIVICRYEGENDSPVVPSFIEGKPVTKIASECFSGRTDIVSVTLPATLQRIEAWAFFGCDHLKTVYFDGTVEEWCAVTFLDMPCRYGAALYISGREVKDLEIPEGVPKIAHSAFSGCTSLESVTIQGSAETVRESTFSDCTNLKSVTIGKGVTSIGNNAFSNCTALSAITVPDGMTTIGSAAFSQCANLTSVSLPDGVTEIGSRAFSGCASLREIALPDSVTGIGWEAFSYCTSLCEIGIPDGVSKLDCTFRGCRSLTRIDVPASVGYIDDLSPGCTALSAITVDEANKNYISAGNCLIGKESKTLVAGCKNSVIPDDGSVTVIGGSAFVECTGLTGITIPDSVVLIEGNAFYGCTGLQTINLSAGLCEIGGHAFDGCTALSSVLIPGSVTYIEEYAFANCTGLRHITFGQGVTSIVGICFRGCTGVVSLTLPVSLQDVSGEAFVECAALETVYYRGTMGQWLKIWIDDDDSPLIYAKKVYGYKGDE